MRRSIWTDEYQKLRKALKNMRVEAHLNQKDLAILLDKPRTFVTKYENADRNLDLLEVIKVCKACNKDPLAFLKQLLQEIN